MFDLRTTDPDTGEDVITDFNPLEGDTILRNPTPAAASEATIFDTLF